MKDWLAEVLVVVSYSGRTQFALLMAVVSFFGILLLGQHMVTGVHFDGPLTPLTEVIQEKLMHRYDKAAWGALFSFLLLAVKLYRKDRKRIFKAF